MFTKIVNREIPADIIYEDDEIIAFKDINPQAPVHFLVVPKKEISTLNDIQEADALLVGKMFCVVKKIAKDLDIDKSGYRTVFNCNDDAGQTVLHIHLHVLAGRVMVWPPG